MADDVANEDVDVKMAAINPDHLEHEKRYQRQFALDYALRLETIASSTIHDNPVAIRKRIFEHAEQIIKYIETGEADVLGVQNGEEVQ